MALFLVLANKHSTISDRLKILSKSVLNFVRNFAYSLLQKHNRLGGSNDTNNSIVRHGCQEGLLSVSAASQCKIQIEMWD